MLLAGSTFLMSKAVSSNEVRQFVKDMQQHFVLQISVFMPFSIFIEKWTISIRCELGEFEKILLAILKKCKVGCPLLVLSRMLLLLLLR